MAKKPGGFPAFVDSEMPSKAPPAKSKMPMKPMPKGKMPMKPMKSFAKRGK